MSRSILPPDVMDVIGGDERDAKLIAHGDEGLVHLLKLGDGLPLYLKIKIAKYPLVPLCRLFGILKSSVQNQPGNLARQTAGKSNQPILVLLQKFFIHPWPVVKALKMRLGYELDKVLVAGVIFSEENEMIMVSVSYIAARATSWRKVNLTADDGLDTHLPGGTVELNDAIHGAVVGYRQTVHTELFGP
ncbi:hypothetical protein ES703_39333 [subsurface metagenome]